ncbi:sodium:solute symporter [Mucilaginibacter sp. AK015]|uniref:sodium:solute symporter n=1 Tax=Mucilaginibacter sp. AK015 TaxID=2723072 RepID=UPI001618E420|nr:sodium:solute symporter [Mucilaginibacter sp. AK015]MBB5394648.1 SSS family solute:Na+ symporter [Mucilaginibacter sp. AK015]
MIGSFDATVSILYVILILAIGLWTGLRHRSASKKTNVASDYFLAGKSLRWPMIGLALFATNISCVHLVSLAQSGFDTGLLNGTFEWMASFTLILLAVFFVPFYIKSGVSTLPDFLEKRYNRASRDWLAFISILSAIIIHISFSLLAGGIVLQTLFGVNMYTSIIIISVITTVYTVVGGLKAVVVTESIQTVVLLSGAVIMSIVAYNKAGGWDSMVHVLQQKNEMSKLSMMRPHGDSSGLPWYAVLLGYPVLGIWYWCADQTIVQRVLGARDENHARVGPLFCGFIKILPVFIFVMPGLFAYALYQTGQLDVHSIKTIVDGKEVVNSKGIYTLMILQLIPKGLAGVLVAALLSGLMSQISGALNSISTMASYDIYKRYKPDANDQELVTAGKIAAGVSFIISLLLLPLLNSYESIFNGLNDIIAHIAPPITCVFLLGVFWGRASAKSAQLTLYIGSAAGVLVFAFSKLMPHSFIGAVPFMMMAFYLFVFCLVLQGALTLAYPATHTAESAKLYWRSPLESLKSPGWYGFGNYKFLSVLLISVMVVLFWIFR